MRMPDHLPVTPIADAALPPKRIFWQYYQPVSEQLVRNFERFTDFSSVAMPFVGWLKMALRNIPVDIDEHADVGMQISLDVLRSVFVFVFAVSLLVRPDHKALPENQVRSVLTLASAAMTAIPLTPMLSGFALPFYTAGRVLSLASTIYMYHRAIDDLEPIFWLEKKLLQKKAIEETMAREGVSVDRIDKLRKRLDRMTLLTAARVRMHNKGPEDAARKIQRLCDQFGFDAAQFPAAEEEDALADREEAERLQNRVSRLRCRILQKCISCLALVAVSCALITVVPALNVAGFVLMLITAAVSAAPVVRRSSLYQKSAALFSRCHERLQEVELAPVPVQGVQMSIA